MICTSIDASGGAVFGLDLDADRAQKIIRQDTAGIDDHGIVVDAQLPTRLLQQYLMRMDLSNLRTQHDLESSLRAGGLHPLTVARFRALKGITSVGQDHLSIAQLGDAGGCLKRAVAASNHHDFPSAVLL